MRAAWQYNRSANMQIACCQFDAAWEDKPANYRKVRAMVTSARLDAGAMLLLPEMFATGFSMNTAATAESIDGPTAKFLSELARQHRIFVLGGAVVTDPATGRPRNEALAFAPDGRPAARYAKMRPFTLSKEHEHHAAGERSVAFDWSGCRVAPAVCYDLRFPELFRLAARGGAELLAVIASWPVARVAHWNALLAARAIENQAYVAGCNRIGRDGAGLDHNGQSRIIHPAGDVLADAGAGETIISAEVDLAALRQYRQKLPFLTDMR